MNPELHQECFVRNKRDYCFQILPRLNFDARKDYESAIKFYKRHFCENQDINVEVEKEEAAPVDENKANDENEEMNESATSLVGDSEDGIVDPANQGVSSMSSAMRKDQDNQKRKIQTLEKKLRDEDFQNSRIIQNRKGEFIEYGNTVQLLHVSS